MKFCKISLGEYEGFWKKCEQGTFLNSGNIVRLWPEGKCLYYGVREKGKMVLAGLVRVCRWHLGLKEFFIPDGPIGRTDCATLEFFLKNIKRELIKNRAVRVRVAPNVLRKERDVDGEVVLQGFDNSEVDECFYKCGFRLRKYVEGASQIKWQYVLKLTNGTSFEAGSEGKIERFLTEEELLAKFKGNTRRAIMQGEDYGFIVKRLNREELEDFQEIMEKTGERRGFTSRGLDYYRKMYDAFYPDIQFTAVYMRPAVTMWKLTEKKKKIQGWSEADAASVKLKKDALASIEARIKRVSDDFCEHLDDEYEVMLAAGMFVTYGNEIVHVFGGNRGEYMKYNAQYVLQWEMIREALRLKKARYNFYGVAENVAEVVREKGEGYGVFEFKRGFSGAVEEKIGEYQGWII